MSSQKGRKITWGAKISAAKMGHSVSAEARKKIGLSSIGRIPWNKNKKMSKETCLKISIAQIGRKLSEDHKKKIKEASLRLGLKPPVMKGPKNPRWIADRSLLAKKQERNDPAYREWRNEVFKRDGNTCCIRDIQCCGKLVAHHILPWSKFPDLRYQINNGIILCQFHHPKKRDDEMKLSPYFQNIVASINQLG